MLKARLENYEGYVNLSLSVNVDCLAMNGKTACAKCQLMPMLNCTHIDNSTCELENWVQREDSVTHLKSNHPGLWLV